LGDEVLQYAEADWNPGPQLEANPECTKVATSIHERKEWSQDIGDKQCSFADAKRIRQKQPLLPLVHGWLDMDVS